LSLPLLLTPQRLHPAILLWALPALLLALLAGEVDLLGIDDDDMVAAIHVRRESRLVLAAQPVGDDGGHTADDQAETVLHRLLRGTGLHGLAGMRVARELAPGVSLLRPLLGVPRSVVRDFLTRVGQAWREDESNLDRNYARNFLRHEILARCAAGPYPDASAAITRLASQAATVSVALRAACELILESHASRHADGSVVVRTQGLAAVDPHLAAELFAALWQREGWPQRDMTARHYASLAALLRDDSPPAIDFPGGIHARRATDGFVILRRA
jgi:tRNA(Ile)-lysidine synthase